MVNRQRQRSICPHCQLHTNICVCDQCQTVANGTPITVIQHPSEVGRSKGTLRILERCLGQLQVVVGESPEQLQQAGLSLADLNESTAVLFPGSNSQPLEEANTGAIKRWLLLDGTWRKAAKILHLNPHIAALPRFHFTHPPTSQYVVRKAPAEHHLSTAEAASHLLKTLEPGLDIQPINTAMAALVDRQLAQIPPELKNRYLKTKER
ncbi:tRNA-uridine aminocarboxypropyltransferase [Marinobacter sediminum]|uniref:tRNA-uridine aminocarboxypropyltransferase n=1 Tax=Marinobacter sediminum TaxID=256323 RepID=UPI003566A64D